MRTAIQLPYFQLVSPARLADSRFHSLKKFIKNILYMENAKETQGRTNWVTVAIGVALFIILIVVLVIGLW